MIDRPRRVVLLIDYDNLQICASRDTPGRDLQLTPVVQLAQRYGTVILARAYAEWNLSTERLAVYKAGIEPAFAPVLRTESDRSGKSLADTVMVAEGMDMLWTLSPEVVVLATSDKDLIPLVRVAKQRGSFVVVLGSDFTAIPLREMADEHFTYRSLITEAAAREGGPARQPAALPEPSRRRSRDRTGRERGTSASTSTATASAPVTPTTPARPEREAPARPEREAPARPEREAPAAAAATAAPTAAATHPAEPVAPATTGDAESAGGRRRRRRGSRRRAERLGQTPEGGAAFESAGTGDGDQSAGELAPSIGEIAQASNGTVEEVPPAEAATTSAGAAPAEPATAAPRERRRRTRRSTTETAAAAAEPAASAGEPLSSAPEAAAAGEVVPLAAAAPTGEAPAAASPGAAAAPRGEGGAGEAGEPSNGDAAPAPRRSRRVASAARGRTRSVGR